MTTSVTVQQAANLPAPISSNPWLEAASEAGTDVGRLLKYVKGKYEIDGNEIPLGTEFIAYIDQLARAWNRFDDDKLAEQHIIKIASGQKLPPREELGHQDRAKWEKDSSGKPKDPWCEQWYLPLVRLDNGEVVTYVTGSKGGVGAIGRLCNVYGRRLDGTLPIVALGTRSYKHKEFGRVETPIFEIVGWEGTPNPNPAKHDLNDEIPF